MASGIKKHIAEVTHLGIKTEGLDTLEAEANKAIEMIQEVDALRQTVSEKLQAANEKLADVRNSPWVTARPSRPTSLSNNGKSS